MKFKKITALFVGATMVLSLTACTSPKDFFTKIFTGNSGNSDSILEEAKVTNKEAVFELDDELYLDEGGDGYSYYTVKYLNGKAWAFNLEYVYPKYDYSEDDITTLPDEEITIMPREKEDEGVTENGTEAEEPVEDAGSEGEESADEEYVDGDYPVDEYAPETTSYSILKVASFTSSSDVQRYGDIIIESGAYANSTDQIGIDQDGNIYFSVVTYDENYNDLYNIRKYDLNGQLLKEVQVDKNYLGDDWSSISSIVADFNGNVYVQTSKYHLIYDSELNLKNKIEIDNNNGWTNGYMCTRNGEILVPITTYTSTNDEYKEDYALYQIKPDGSLVELACSAETYGKSIVTGGGYDIYFNTNTSVEAMNISDTSSVEVVNFFDSNINPYDFSGAIFIDSETFASVESDDEGRQCIRIYKKIPAELVMDKQVVTLAAVGLDYAIARRISDYNKTSDKYKIKFVDYSTYNTEDDYSAGSKRFNTDLTSGNVADIIIPDYSTDVMNLAKKGVFADLTPIMEASNGVKKSDLVYCAQHTYADGDKLYVVFPTYSVECFQLKKSAFDGELTLDDLKAWEQKTGNKAFSDDFTSDGVLYYCIMNSMDAFLDSDTGKCNFDSQEFIDILEYAKTYPDKLPDDYWEEYDYNKYTNMFRADQAMLSFTSISNFRDYNWSTQSSFGEDTVVTGLKFGESEGTIIYSYQNMGISAKSKNKEAAWDFINSCFSDEFYELNQWELPTLESKMDEVIEAAKQKPYYYDDNGEKVEYDETYYWNDQEFVVEPITDKQAAELKAFVTNITSTYSYDDELMNIITEETEPYFQGQKSAKDVAAVIQSRLQIYVSEKK